MKQVMFLLVSEGNLPRSYSLPVLYLVSWFFLIARKSEREMPIHIVTIFYLP